MMDMAVKWHTQHPARLYHLNLNVKNTGTANVSPFPHILSVNMFLAQEQPL
jgi:hypothetical protein